MVTQEGAIKLKKTTHGMHGLQRKAGWRHSDEHAENGGCVRIRKSPVLIFKYQKDSE